MQRADSSEPIVDFVYGSTHLSSGEEKWWKAVRLYEAPSRITFLLFFKKRIRNQIGMRRLPSFLSLIHFIPRK